MKQDRLLSALAGAGLVGPIIVLAMIIQEYPGGTGFTVALAFMAGAWWQARASR